MLTTEKRYSVHGRTLRTAEHFGNLPAAHITTADLEYILSRDRDPRALVTGDVVYQSLYADKYGTPRLIVSRALDHLRLRYSGVAVFHLSGSSIFCYPSRGVSPKILEEYFLGGLLSLWLEQHGIPVLHAAAFVVNGCAVGFLSNSGGGKSVLAASMVQSGYALVTDDKLAVEASRDRFLVHPSYPEMRLWPSEAKHFFGQSETAAMEPLTRSKVHIALGSNGLGKFCREAVPLGCLYLPSRRSANGREAEVEIVPVSPRESLIELVRHSFVARIVEALGMQSERLRLFARLSRSIPMRRLFYPDGLQYLPRVRDVMLEDLNRLRQNGGDLSFRHRRHVRQFQ